MNDFRTVYGNSISQNGWRMCNRSACVVANSVPFSNTAPVRKGVAATILNGWLIYYHRHIEPITTPVWGWSETNAVRDSNHLAGTSLDIHAPRYNMGVRQMPAGIVTKVRKGIELFGGSMSWGGLWNYPDQMHYQLGWREGDPRVAAFAQRLSDGYLGIYGKDTPPAPTPVPTPGTSRPTLRRGDKGEHVRYLQDLLNRLYASYSKLIVDGDFGPATEDVVRQMQGRIGIAIDGIVGPASWIAMGVK